MTVRQALKLYGLVGLPVTILAATAAAQWRPDAAIIPTLVFAVLGVAVLRCPRCRILAGWTRYVGPMSPAGKSPAIPRACTWCGLDFEEARLGQAVPPEGSSAGE